MEKNGLTLVETTAPLGELIKKEKSYGKLIYRHLDSDALQNLEKYAEDAGEKFGVLVNIITK